MKRSPKEPSNPSKKTGAVFRFWRPYGDPATKTALRKDGFFPGVCPYSPQLPREISPRRETNRGNPITKPSREGITEHKFRPKTPKTPSFSVWVAKRKEYSTNQVTETADHALTHTLTEHRRVDSGIIYTII